MDQGVEGSCRRVSMRVPPSSDRPCMSSRHSFEGLQRGINVGPLNRLSGAFCHYVVGGGHMRSSITSIL